jgi:hypothetical protein
MLSSLRVVGGAAAVGVGAYCIFSWYSQRQSTDKRILSDADEDRKQGGAYTPAASSTTTQTEETLNAASQSTSQEKFRKPQLPSIPMSEVFFLLMRNQTLFPIHIQRIEIMCIRRQFARLLASMESIMGCPALRAPSFDRMHGLP